MKLAIDDKSIAKRLLVASVAVLTAVAIAYWVDAVFADRPYLAHLHYSGPNGEMHDFGDRFPDMKSCEAFIRRVQLLHSDSQNITRAECKLH